MKHPDPAGVGVTTPPYPAPSPPSRPLRIAQPAGWYSPTSGGIRTVVHRLGAGYRAAGHTAVPIVPGVRDVLGENRVELKGIPVPRSGGYRYVWRSAALHAALDHITPDVVELHDKFWLPAVRRWADRSGVPVALVTHERFDRTLPTLLPALPPSVTAAVAERLRCSVQRHADVVVACSAFAAAEFPGAHLIPLGADLETFRPRPAPPSPRIELVLASRLSREKRPDLAIEAVRTLVTGGVDVRLTVYGHGPLARALRIQAEGLPVRFAGHTADRAELARVLAGADVVVAPGPAETFGLSALEALASGTPVVAAAGAAVAELVAQRPGAGEVAALDGPAFARAVLRVLDVAGPVRRAAARAVAEAHPWERTVDAFLALHTKQAGHHGVTTPPTLARSGS